MATRILSLRRFLTCLLLLTGLYGSAQERFTSWHSEVEIRPDRSIEVTETIRVIAAGAQVQRGIYRELVSPPGQEVRIRSARRDGERENYRIERDGDLLTLYLGSRDVLLKPGAYVYTIVYTARNQVVINDGVDELDLNVIGPGIALPIDTLTATVRYPGLLPPVQYRCYTGAAGSRENDCTMTAPEAERLEVRSTGPSGNGRLLTVAVGFADGVFAPLEGTDLLAISARRRGYFQTPSVLILWLGGLLCLLYGYRSWRRYGRDPVVQPVPPLIEPPYGQSPATIGLLSRTSAGRFGRFTASLMALSTLNYLKIEPVEDHSIFKRSAAYRIEQIDNSVATDRLPEEQRLLYRELFAGSDNFELRQRYDERLGRIVANHEDYLREKHKAFVWEGHNGRLTLYLLVALIAIGIAGAIAIGPFDGAAARGTLLGYGIVATLGILVYGLAIVRPSREKVEHLARIDAFREYLSIGERERLCIPGAPAMDRAHYEELLPYAIALGLNNKWSEYFAEITGASGAGQFNPVTFTTGLTSAVRRSSTPPASSSGGGGSSSGGGGSAGGGSGGGGAGGW